MAQTLLPCPFCGHESPSFERLGTARRSCIVVCGNCGARHESSDEDERNGSSWNCRAERAEAAQRVPQGWKLVPVEPTPAMCLAGADAMDARARNRAARYAIRGSWAAMLAAAPDAPQAAQRAPLTDAQIEIGLDMNADEGELERLYFTQGARFAEAFHGITATEPKGERDAEGN